MKVILEREKRELNIKASNVKELLRQLKLQSNTVMVVKNNNLVLEDEKLEEKDVIRILPVISGG